MIFRINNCDFGFKYNGQSYDFEHCDGMTIEDGQQKTLQRGINSKNKTGIPILEGGSTADVITIPIMNVPTAIINLLNRLYETEERITGYVIDRKTGDARFINNALISKRVRQLSISENRDDLNIQLTLQSFDVDDKLKEEAA
ncbi:MAG: hypothetical protein LBD46_06595 [Endomicrobium sp.]|jgi:hypothetical protein|nr:hypothetical protein [Endomicrobium sp.]